MSQRAFLSRPFAIAALAGGLLAAPALSQAQGLLDETTGPYIGAGLGSAELDNPCPPGSSNCDDSGTVWKIYGGWQMNKWLSAELGYMDFHEVDFRGTTGGGVPFRGHADTWGITGFAVGRFPIPIGSFDRLSILGKIGTMYYNRDRSSNLGAYDSDDDGFAFAWGLGLQYTFNERVGLRAEYERFENVGDGSAGRGDINAYTFSVNYKF